MRIVALVMLGSMLTAAQRPAIKVRVDAVTIDALATDDGRPIAGLGASHFEISDNGVLQKIDRVESQSVPLDMVLVLDVSGSVRGETFARLSSGARAAVRALRPEDRGIVLSFAHWLTAPSPLTGDVAALERAINAMRPSGSTALFNATFVGLLVGGEPGRRTVVLVYTDGIDTVSWLNSTNLLRAAGGSDAVIYAIAPDPAGPPQRLMPGANVEIGPQREGTGRPAPTRVLGGRSADVRLEVLARLTTDSGGRLMTIRDGDGLERVFRELVDEFKNRYLITYYPEGVTLAGWHDINVTLKGRRGKIQARRGYYGD